MSEELFWSIADALIDRGGAQPGTIMGFPCLRSASGGKNGEGEFVAMPFRDGSLVVKLTADRVAELIDEGLGAPFNITGRTFTEWVVASEPDRSRWTDLLQEGLSQAA